MRLQYLIPDDKVYDLCQNLRNLDVKGNIHKRALVMAAGIDGPALFEIAELHFEIPDPIAVGARMPANV